MNVSRILRSKKAIARMHAILLIVLVLVVVVASYFGYTTLQPKPAILTVATWGGVWGDTVKSIFDSWGASNNVQVKYHIQEYAGETLAKLRAEKASPTIDLWYGTWGAAYLASQEGMTVAITPDNVPNINDVIAPAVGSYNGTTWFVGWTGFYGGIGIRTDKVDESKVTSWKWLWSNDSDIRPKKLSIPDVSYNYGQVLVTAAYAWGADEHNIDVGFSKVKELAPNVGVVYTSEADLVRPLVAGDTVAGIFVSGDAYSVAKAGAPFKLIFPQDGSKIFADYRCCR